MIGYQGGAPVKFLDWHGFNETLSKVTADVFLLLAQSWILWGAFNLGKAWLTNTLTSWTLPDSIGASLEWLGMLVLFGLLSWAAYVRYTTWRRVTVKTWVRLYEMWQKLPTSVKH